MSKSMKKQNYYQRLGVEHDVRTATSLAAQLWRKTLFLDNIRRASSTFSCFFSQKRGKKYLLTKNCTRPFPVSFPAPLHRQHQIRLRRRIGRKLHCTTQTKPSQRIKQPQLKSFNS